MARPELSLERGVGWHSTQWEDFKPVLDKSSIKVLRGLAHLGITYGLPKRGKIARIKEDTLAQPRGQAFDHTNFRVTVVTEPREKNYVNQMVTYVSSVTIHEVVHCVRYEHQPYANNLFEFAATEGLAFMAEFLYLSRNDNQAGIFQGLKDNLEPDYALEENFLRDANSNRGRQLSIHKRWFTKINDSGIPDGALYGFQRVSEQMRNGYELAQLIPLTSEKVLDI